LDRVSIDPACLVTTPFQQAAGRLRELLRVGKRHGSCGVGVGETVADALATPELAIRVGELLRPERVLSRLEAQREHKCAEFAAGAGTVTDPVALRELSLLNDSNVSKRWLSSAAAVARVVQLQGDEAVRDSKGPVVFEGAQGVLLDEDFGFHPFTTWSRCTPIGARQLLSRVGWCHPVETVGVLRAYAVRHGPGPLPTEDARVVAKSSERHNEAGPWQGSVRKGWLDLVLLDYALRACGGIDALAVTHLDALGALAPYRWCERYGSLATLELPRNISEQAKLSQVLFSATPHYAMPLTGAPEIAPEALCRKLVECAGVPVKYGSFGPTAAAVFEHERAAQ
jgi:adenylosuccinate synthase